MENLSMIAAVGNNGELGLNNQLIWKIKEDLKFYRDTTMGKNIIMGRNTFESMPLKAFEGRNPIVVSHYPLDKYYDAAVFNNTLTLLEYICRSEEEFMVVGGSSIYKEFLPFADTIYLTEIMKTAKADAFFPYFCEDSFDVTELGDFSNEEIPYVRKKYVRRKTYE